MKYLKYISIVMMVNPLSIKFADSELKDMKSLAIELIKSNRKIIKFLQEQEKLKTKKSLDSSINKKSRAKFKLISNKDLSNKKFKFINKKIKHESLLPDILEQQKFEMIQKLQSKKDQSKKSPVNYPQYTFEIGLRNLSDGSGDGIANDQETYFHIGKKVNENREYFFEAKEANIGAEGDGDVKRLGLGVKHYFSERDKRLKPYFCYGLDFINSSFRSYQGIDIINGYQTKVVGIGRLGAEYYCSKKIDLNMFYERSGGTLDFDTVNGKSLRLKSTENVYGVGVKYKW
ncbi:MAG: hypothetical protein COB02_09115 [Candidatus Cloacimonadota bacterium]|nr:MAG: hypothetical protein COB02_09115 [Candidatus Cloacimonadota bacterium]